MEIVYIGNISFRIKGKNATLTIGEDITIAESEKVVNSPGEYEIKGVSIVGVDAKETTLYRIDLDGLTLLHLGNLQKKLTDSQLKEIGEVDIAFIQANSEFENIAHAVSPTIIIPFNHEGQDDVISKLGVNIEKMPKFTVKLGELVTEDQKIIILEKK